ncbi:hypothetical protein [Evansella cellulosilytica]|uniref:Uncharacterized protein n=1 Tax=Evansella cellulosilytica (strain ATCC 21833 / DSM 2522 / FERM P-1141 / JCM 9156 / N-4) TaxID=649639 RepID=E6TUV3_EVAC2|nr:hypothetical protein [Evansella cellulosilytica]ADU32105.1 hypothetical protein Bcell_3866 [Evansella cellulosilytica DSM 2522]
MFSGKNNKRYPYIILLVIHSGLLLYTFARKKDRKALVVLLFSNMGIAYLFEYLVLSFLHLYKYKPKFFKKNFLDDISGAILSQAVYVPFTALFITAFQLNWIVKVAFAIYFSVVEKVFIKMRIYKLQGWKIRYTLVLIVMYFYLSDWWLKLLKKGNAIIQRLTLFNMMQFTGINSLVSLEMPRILSFGVGRYHSTKEQHKVETSYSTLMSLIKTVAAWKGNLSLKVMFLLIKIMLDITLKRKGIIKIKSTLVITMIDLFLLTIGPTYKKWIHEIAANEDGSKLLKK